jgi:porin
LPLRDRHEQLVANALTYDPRLGTGTETTSGRRSDYRDVALVTRLNRAAVQPLPVPAEVHLLSLQGARDAAAAIQARSSLHRCVSIALLNSRCATAAGMAMKTPLDDSWREPMRQPLAALIADSMICRLLRLSLCSLLCATRVLASDDTATPDARGANAISLDSMYFGEIWHQATGGVATGTHHLDKFELALAVDGSRGAGLEELKFLADVTYSNGDARVGDASGSIQGVSGIEASPGLRLYELWIEKTFLASTARLRLGLLDLNSTFDSLETASLFLNPSYGMDATFAQSGRSGPATWPISSLGMQAQKSLGRCSINAATVDGDPGDPRHSSHTSMHMSSREGALLIGELNCVPVVGSSIGIGYWHYTGEFPELRSTDGTPSPLRNDNSGAYLLAESPNLFTQSALGGVQFFVRIGAAQSHINAIEEFLGAGAVLKGSLGPRFPCQFGVAANVARLGPAGFNAMKADGGRATRNEYNYEVTLRVDVTDTVSLQADVQHFVNPGMEATSPDSWAVGLRVEVVNRWARQ